MHKIESPYTLDQTLEKLDKAIIRHSLSSFYMYGFLGKINREKNRFWIVNHSNTYRTRKGLKFKTYRRFEGYFTETLNGVSINGSFALRPYNKIMLSIYSSFITIILLFALLLSDDIITRLKLASTLVFMLLVAIGVIQFNLKKTKESEAEIIEFIQDVVYYKEETYE